jgi:hypothetical protein
MMVKERIGVIVKAFVDGNNNNRIDGQRRGG